ncbi:MAG: PEGA domain-containing protein [Chitinispirillaceae bacterium]|nr:PEGA domain-containing protein [Chitinispirillaceae bacterium]
MKKNQNLKELILVIISGLIGIFNASGDGYLTVRTEPEGIEVWLDDKFIGESPIVDKKLKSGRYSLKLVDPVQHSSTVEEIFIQENENTVIERTISSKFGTLKITTVPEGANVLIATDLGSTPLSNDFMNPGKYRLEIRHPNKKYLPIVENIVIPRGETVSISKTLEKEKSFDQKDFWRLMLGAGTAAGYITGAFAIGRFRELNECRVVDRSGPLALSIIGISVGSLCLIGLEILSFF